jgi:anti-sigma regulatory factor (Ser/Thr protein kinase)
VPVAQIWLTADVRSAGDARRFVASTLDGWTATAYQDVAVLVVSELVANAALHAKTEIGVRIELKPDCLRLSVSDGSARLPVMRHYSEQATTGRGLTLVTVLARDWGVESHPDGGKTVWAEVESEQVEQERPPERETSPDLRLIHGGSQAAPMRCVGQGDTTNLRRGA